MVSFPLFHTMKNGWKRPSVGIKERRLTLGGTLRPMNAERNQTSAELAAAFEAGTATDPDEPSSFTIFPSAEFDLQSMGFVRLEDALDALVTPDSFVAFEHQDSPRMYLGAKGPGAFVLLTLAYGTGGTLDLAASYRLHGSEAELAAFAEDARAAFQALLERYALPFRSGKGHALFLPILRVKGTDAHIEWDLGLPTSTPWLLNRF